ncbi:MAG: lysine--tRNA ligase [Patescibacteria group bacterium]
MSREQEIRSNRIEKKKRIEEAGMEAYATSTKQGITLGELKKTFATLYKKNKDTKYRIVGRIMSQRGSGKISFVSLFDGTDSFQVVFRVDDLGKEKMQFFTKNFDIGDFVEVHGYLGKTKSKAQSLFVTKYSMLTKALLPLPDAHYGLVDEELKYRKRYLDALLDQEVRKRFVLRAQVIKTIREFLNDKGLLEVETPILQSQAGGAMAEVFDTHHKDFDQNMHLRIALELDHKMMMIAGYPGVYEIGKCFRNEGSDPTHHQEFTMLEWYAAYQDLKTNMRWMQELIKKLAKLTGEKEFIVYDNQGLGTSISFGGKWPVVSFRDLVKKYAKLDIHKADRKTIESKALEYGMTKKEIKIKGDANLLDFIYKKSARSKIINPTFVVGYPSDLIPLAQKNDDGTADMYQLVVGGAEVVKSFNELVDPLLQRELLERQSHFKTQGDHEAMEIDERFLEAMEYGMPPMTGCGMGIDRLMAILCSRKNLKDVIFFPLMKDAK